MFESFAWDQLIQRAKVRRAIKFESFLKRVWDSYLWRKFGNFRPISNQLELATSYSSFTVEPENLKKFVKKKLVLWLLSSHTQFHHSTSLFILLFQYCLWVYAQSISILALTVGEYYCIQTRVAVLVQVTGWKVSPFFFLKEQGRPFDKFCPFSNIEIHL